MLLLRKALFERVLAAEMACLAASRPARFRTRWCTKCRMDPTCWCKRFWASLGMASLIAPAGIPAVPELATDADRGGGSAGRGLDHERPCHAVCTKLTKFSQQATDELAYVVEENVLAHQCVFARCPAKFASRFGALSQSLRRLAIKSTIASAAMTPLTHCWQPQPCRWGDLHRPVAKPWGGGLQRRHGRRVCLVHHRDVDADCPDPQAGGCGQPHHAWRCCAGTRFIVTWVTPGQSRKARTCRPGAGRLC